MTLEEVRQRLIDAMALDPSDHEGWVQIAEERLYAHRARMHPFKRAYDVSTVGARIRTAREVCGMSIPQMALRLGVDPRDVSGWERGRRNLPADMLPRLCLVLGVKQAWVLGTSEEGGPPVPTGQLRKRITERWKQRKDFLAARDRAREEMRRLNAYRVEVRTGDVSAQNPPAPGPEIAPARPKSG